MIEVFVDTSPGNYGLTRPLDSNSLSIMSQESTPQLRPATPNQQYQAPVVGADGLVKTLHHPEGIDPNDLFFNEEVVSALILEWKKTHDPAVWGKIVQESIPLIDTLILHGRFTEYDQLDALRSECVIKLYKLLERFDPARGRAFTIFSISVRNFLLTYSQKVDSKAKSVFNAEDEFLDTIEGHVYVAQSYSKEFRDRVMDLDTRFHEKNYVDAMRYLVAYFLKEGFSTSKSKLCASLTSIYDLTPENSYFLYDYTLVKMRSAMYDLFDPPVLDVELLRMSKRWTLIPELVELIGIKSVSKIAEVFSGVNVTFPTKRDLEKLKAERNILNRLKNRGCSALDVKSAAEEFGGDPQSLLERVSDSHFKQWDETSPLFESLGRDGRVHTMSETEDTDLDGERHDS